MSSIDQGPHGPSDSEAYRDERKYLEDTPFLTTAEPVIPQRRRYINWWAVSTFVLAALLILDFALHFRESRQQRSYDNGFATDLRATWGKFDMVEVQFTGGLYYNESKQLAMTDPLLGERRYVGPASDEIDEAWMSLIGKSFEALRPELAAQIDPSYYMSIDPSSGYYRGGLDVMHTLHCVDMFRMNLDPERYEKKGILMTGRSKRLHLEHCVNQLRQAIMCHGDATVMPEYWEPRAKRMMPNFDTKHTCRNWGAIRSWVDENVSAQEWREESPQIA